MRFVDISTSEIELKLDVLTWRNHPEIRKNMYVDTVITLEEHKEWLNDLESNKKTKIYVAFKGDYAIGIVSINNINYYQKNADWAFYLNPEYLNVKGLGTLMEYHFLNYIFENFDIDKLNCEVLEKNKLVIKLHKKFGFIEEGIRRKNVIKDKQRTNVFLLGILRDEWAQEKNKFSKIIARLEH